MGNMIWVDIPVDEYGEREREIEREIQEAVGDEYIVWTSPATMHTLSMDEYRGLRGAVRNMNEGRE